MKKLLNSSSTFFVFCVVVMPLLLTSCGSKPPPPKDEEVTTDTASMDAKVVLDQIFVNIPPPSDLAKELSKSGMNYNKGILNSSSRGSGYSTNFKAAANLGVFGADLSYTSSYGQTQDALGYLNAIKQLSDKVGVGAAFDETMIKRFEGNAANKDTMEAIINSAYDKASRNLRSNQRISTAAVVSAGGWVEALYISTQVLSGAEKTAKNEATFQRVWTQLYAYQYVAELLNMYVKTPDCAQMIKEISVMEEMVGIYGKQTSLSPADVKLIGEKIAAIRTALIN